MPGSCKGKSFKTFGLTRPPAWLKVSKKLDIEFTLASLPSAALMRFSFKYIKLFAAAALIYIPCEAFSQGASLPGSVLADSLAFPGETYVITSDELSRYNINSIEDILEILPGVSYWMEGTAGSNSGFSVDGIGMGGISLLVNGFPFADPYDDASLFRFVPLSRLRRVEVIYGGSNSVSSVASSGCVINLVLEEGGREGPLSAADFTNGRSNKRSRRIWFATPRSYVNAVFAYDQYLQNPVKALADYPGGLIGNYDSKSVLVDLSFMTQSSEKISLMLHTFEDRYAGTALAPASGTVNPGEYVRHSGFDSRIGYSKGDLDLVLRRLLLDMDRDCGYTSGSVTAIRGTWRRAFSSYRVKVFGSAERRELANNIWRQRFDPRYSVAEGGVTMASGASNAFGWRTGIFGGHHQQTGPWLGGEAALYRGKRDGFYQRLSLSRRARIPSAKELFQPDLDVTVDGAELATSGNENLVHEVVEEASVGAGLEGRAALDLFARRHKNMIVLSGPDGGPMSYANLNGGESYGARGTVTLGGKILGVDWGFTGSAEYYGKGDGVMDGVPEYRLLGRVFLERLSFKKTERLNLSLDAVETGGREWNGSRLERYSVMNASLSLSIMSAIVRIQMNNLLDSEYQTVPGYLMPERHFRMGFIWYFFD